MMGMIAAESTVAMPLLLRAEEAARLIGVSRSQWWSLHSAGRVSSPVRFGRAVGGRREELERWVAGGCPWCPTGGKR